MYVYTGWPKKVTTFDFKAVLSLRNESWHIYFLCSCYRTCEIQIFAFK